jgi:hypothetical protein
MVAKFLAISTILVHNMKVLQQKHEHTLFVLTSISFLSVFFNNLWQTHPKEKQSE